MCLSDLSPASCLRTIICSSLFLAFQVSGASQATLCITPCFPIPLPVFAQLKDLLCFSSNHFLPTVLHASCHPDLPPPRLSFTSAPFPTLFFQLATEPSLCRTSYWGLFLHPSPLISLHCHDLQLKAPGLPCSSFTLCVPSPAGHHFLIAFISPLTSFLQDKTQTHLSCPPGHS